jgi:hypothetical protein
MFMSKNLLPGNFGASIVIIAKHVTNMILDSLIYETTPYKRLCDSFEFMLSQLFQSESSSDPVTKCPTPECCLESHDPCLYL